jgi:hypothetical protein
MGFGAIIAGGEQNALLKEGLVDCLTEVRVEQFLDEPTRFALRFQEDISEGQPRIAPASELQVEQMLTIAVKLGDTIRCLVRGPVTDTRSSTMLGGPGSWHEVHGEDRRIELDRELVQRRWSGLASAVAQGILERRGFQARVQRTKIDYGAKDSQGRETRQTLNQRATDAAFLQTIARHNNLCFWLEYACEASGDRLVVRETANLIPSPPRSDGEVAPDVKGIRLVPTRALSLRVNVAKERCQNVTAFELRTCSERPNRFQAPAIDDRTLRTHATAATDPQPSIRKDGVPFAGAKAPRNVLIAAPGNPDDVQARAEAVLTASNWFVTATASTTAHLLGGILVPHDVVEVEGLGRVHSGPYQVHAVTHVINAADHFMDLQLRRNAVGKAAT